MSEFDIIIRNQKRPISSRQKTLVRPRRQYEDLGRRRGSFINFYDLGQLNTGTAESPVWITNPWTHAATITPTTIGGDKYISSVSSFTKTDLETFQDTLFDVPFADWPTTFRRLDYDDAYKYGCDIYLYDDLGYSTVLVDDSTVARQPLSHNTTDRFSMRRERNLPFVGFGERIPVTTDQAKRWTRSGLRKASERYMNFTCFSGAFWGWDTIRTIKVTEVKDDFSAFTDNYPIKGGADVYLMPAFYHFASTTTDPTKAYVGFVYGIPDRQLWNDVLLQFAGSSGAAYNNPSGVNQHYLFTMYATPYVVRSITANFVDSANDSRLNDWFNSLDGRQYFNRTSGAGALTTDVDIAGAVEQKTYESWQQEFFPFTASPGVNFDIAFIPQYILVAVIHEGSTWKYVYTIGPSHSGDNAVTPDLILQ